MTTPAVNVLKILEQPSTLTYLYDGYPPYVYGSSTQLSRMSRLRPASISTVKDGGGYRPPTSWYHQYAYYGYSSVAVTRRLSNVTIIRTGSGAFSLGTPDVGPFNDELWGKAINGALKKLKSQEVNLGVAFAERKKTANLFAEGIREIASTYSNFRRSKAKLWDKVRSIKPRVESYPEEWLKVQYGLVPTLNDIDGACQELSGLEEGITHNGYWVRVSKNIFWGDRGVYDKSFANLDGNQGYPLMMDTLTQEDCKAVFYYVLDNPLLAPFKEVGVTNPLDIVWETLPWSFVLDWALPVGSWINQLDADFGYRYLGGSVTRSKRVTAKGQYIANLPSNIWVSDGQLTNMKMYLFKMDRSIFTSAPWPVFPTIRNPFSSSGAPTRVANALSLLSGVFRK